MKKTFILAMILLLAFATGCSTMQGREHRQQTKYLDRLISGDLPDSPDEAQAWLDGITQQVRTFSFIYPKSTAYT